MPTDDDDDDRKFERRDDVVGVARLDVGDRSEEASLSARTRDVNTVST